MDNIQALKNAIEFAKQNPDSNQATELRKRIESGMYVKELNQIKQQSQPGYVAPKEPTLLGNIAKGIGDVATGVQKGVLSTVIGLGQIPLKAYGATGLPGSELAKQSVQTGEDIKKVQATPTNTAQTIGKVGEQLGEMFIPVGAGAKAASKLAKIPELAKTVIKAGAEGAEYGAKTYLQTGGDTKEALQVGTVTGLLSPVAGIIKASGKLASESVIPVSAKEAQLIQAYKANTPFWERIMTGISGQDAGPITAGKTAFNKGLKGTESMIGVQAKKGANNLWNNIIQPSLKNSKSTVDMPAFWKEVEQKIITENPELSRQQSLLEGLNALKDSYKGVESITPEQLQQFKEGWAQFLPQKVYKGQDIAGAFNEVKNLSAQSARSVIYNIVGPEAKQAYFDYGNLVGLQELGQKAMTGGKLKGGFGSFWSAIKDLAVVPAGTIGGQTLYKAGQGIELFGKPGAKTVADLFQD